VENLKNNRYNRSMPYDIDSKNKSIENSEWSGQEITKLISDIHEDYEISTKQRANPNITLHYRDLLSYLIKTYGH